MRHCFKIKCKEGAEGRTGGMAQSVKSLPCKHEDPSSIPSVWTSEMARFIKKNILPLKAEGLSLDSPEHTEKPNRVVQVFVMPVTSMGKWGAET